MKKLLLVCLLLILSGVSYAKPAPPVVSVATSGIELSVSWDEVPSAQGYRLYYAPYPYLGPGTINSIDLGRQTEGVFNLWPDAAYLVAVTAYDDLDESAYSNTNQFFMIPQGPVSPAAPSLTLATSALDVTVSWSGVAGATGYTLHYAPYPFTGASSIGSLGVGLSKSKKFTLPAGSAYYVAASAATHAGESGFSNAELLILGEVVPEWVDADGDGVALGQSDCNDNAPMIHPGADELCGDGIDQDCDGIDSVCSSDQDSDADGYSVEQGDCNDEDETVHPDATEICGDAIDQDCTGFDLICPDDTEPDLDGDGFSVTQGDCNDENEAVHPGATDICGDGIDQDCSGSDLICPDDSEPDLDGDGFSVNQGDCNDLDQSIFPGATETCGDGVDQDCSGADLGCSQDWFLDEDSDGYATGDAVSTIQRPDARYYTVDELTAVSGDCDDGNAAVHPNADEICGDGIDQDCVGGDLSCPVEVRYDWFLDSDLDGYSEGTTINAAVRPSSGYFTVEELTATSGDCNDDDSSVHPSTWENCGDGIDQDCTGSDLVCPSGESSFEAEVRTLINQYRSGNSLGSLAHNLALQGFALEHSQYMLLTGDFSHAGFTEIRAQKAFAEGCTRVVENLAWNTQTPQQTFDGWKNSPPHNENLLDAQINFIGISKAGAYITMIGCKNP